MAEFVRSILGLMLRLGLLLAGLVFFASMLAAAVLLLSVWLLRALWAKLTGKPVKPWVFQMNRRPPWQQAGRGAGFGGTPPRASDDVIDAEARDVTVVTDVEPKRIDPSR
jgi:hypothetical protein